ncbi:MAG: CPBP family intramembrane metalloprotease [Clostridia bacterium]|nr:CPBP family intramembrane metalloprotease [Clostridia bacterium]
MSTNRKTTAAPNCRRMFNRIGWCLVIMIGLMELVWLPLQELGDFLYRVLLPVPGYMLRTFIYAAAYLLLFILPGCLFYVFSRKKPPEPAPIRTTPVMPAYFPLLIFAGLAVITVTANVNFWFVELIGIGGIVEEMVPAYTGMPAASAVALMLLDSLAPAFAEEFLFRGVIYGNLRRYGRPLALTVSALLFALMHQNAAQTFYTFSAGVVMALCYELTGSIWCSVFLHLFNNLYAVIGDVVYARLGDAADPILYLTDAVVILLGIGSALLLVVLIRRKSPRDTAPAPAQSGLFGRLPARLDPEIPEKPDAGTAFRAFWAPGMIVYVALSLTVTVMTLLGYSLLGLFS